MLTFGTYEIVGFTTDWVLKLFTARLTDLSFYFGGSLHGIQQFG